MLLRLYALRFQCTAREPIYFPAGKPCNVLRGGFGMALRRMACRERGGTPYLRAAEWTEVGRQPVWGKGEIAVAFA